MILEKVAKRFAPVVENFVRRCICIQSGIEIDSKKYENPKPRKSI